MNQPTQSSLASSHSDSNHQTTDRAFALLAAAAVITAVIAGFWLLGSPNKQRLMALDRQRLNELQQIASEMTSEYGFKPAADETVSLPDSLESLNIRSDRLLDPESQEPYVYRRLSDSTYELCATFAIDSSEVPRQNFGYDNRERWAYSKGQQCFEFEVSKRYPLP